jgi:DNA-binding MarR family transcriptional regulator
MTGYCMSKLSAKGNTFTELIREIFQVNILLLEAGNQLTAPVGLSGARWQILGIVEHGAVPVAHIARLWGLTRQGVQQTADTLNKDGFVEYLENPHHRRAKLVSITQKGTKALEYIRLEQAGWANRIVEQHALKDLQAVLSTLRELKNTLEHQTIER